jgi:HPt (histidine-containing phosphotransfer) domain-containing protein
VLDPGVLDRLRADLGGDDPVRDVVATFLERTPTVLADLSAAAARDDVEAMRRVAHGIKGTSATLGAARLAEQCAEIERLARSGAVPDAAARVAAVEASYRAAEAALTAKLGG